MNVHNHWGNPNKVGMVYEINEYFHNTHADKGRLREGDFVLCLEHTGDCHYTWARLKEESGNDSHRYFGIDLIYSAYGVDPDSAMPMDCLTTGDLLFSVLSCHVNGRAAVVIPRPQEEIDQLKNTQCILCGRVG